MLLATTRKIVDIFIAQNPKCAELWIGGGVLSMREVDDLRARGYSLTVFAHPISTLDEIEDAKDTIAEHHPNDPCGWTFCRPGRAQIGLA
jgi:hypothetical protein